MRGRACPGAWRCRSGSRGQPFGYELGTHDRHLARCVDAESHLASFQTDDSDTDVVSDEQFFHQLPRQHQHGTVPLGPYKLRSEHRFHYGTTVPAWVTPVASYKNLGYELRRS